MRKLFLCSLIFFSTNLIGQEKKIDSFAIYGLKKSKLSYIKKLIFYTPNQPLDTIKVNENLIRIIREPAVSHAYYTIDTIPDNQLKLNYHIEENKTLIPAVDV